MTARIAELGQALADNPDQPAEVYLELVRALYLAGRYADGERWTAQAVRRHPNAHALWNLHGVMLRMLRRPRDALAALDRAIALEPGQLGVRANRGGVLLDLGRGAEAEGEFAELARADPTDPSHRLQLGRAMARLGRRDEAAAAFRAALALKPDYADAWRQLAALCDDAGDAAGAEAVLDEGLAAGPGQTGLMEAKVLLLRSAGEDRRAEAYLRALAPEHDDQAWLHMHLGDLVAERNRAEGNRHLRRAVALEPSLDHLALLVQSLGRTFGPEEGAALDEAYGLARRLLDSGPLSAGHSSIVGELLLRVCAVEDFERLGDFQSLGRGWAESGRHTALFRLLARVRSDEDRFELLHQHGVWRRSLAAKAAAEPIRRPPARSPDGRIRLGFMSSDLRRHPVGYFALPLFDHIDRERFDVYAYSFFRGSEDPLQARFAGQCAAFRWMPRTSSRAAAQAIADDQLDMLIELGGSTLMNRLDVMAWKPAPRQASWLGYPHSAGLDTIDHFICDPYTLPTDPGLLLEAPLVMPKTWIALGEAIFTDEHAIDPVLPQDRNGALTFGTANNSHKYTAEALRTWARATAAVPGARFAFVRPEGASAAFRSHVLAHFAAEGVAPDRVIFHAVRGAHMPFYNEIDITLDTFPLTGGTTTVEALWMGAPVVSLKGPAFYERLSWSILANAGLADLAAEDLPGFEAIALDLAADRDRRARMRRDLRAALRESPLGQAEAFARDFYGLIASALGRT